MTDDDNAQHHGENDLSAAYELGREDALVQGATYEGQLLRAAIGVLTDLAALQSRVSSVLDAYARPPDLEHALQRTAARLAKAGALGGQGAPCAHLRRFASAPDSCADCDAVGLP